MKPFSEQLRAIMEKRGVSQSELCEKTGIPKSAISQYLSGAFRPKQERTYILAKALKTTPEYLMGFTDCPEIPDASSPPWTIMPEINNGYPFPTQLRAMLVKDKIKEMEQEETIDSTETAQPAYVKKIVGRVSSLSEEEQMKAWEVLKAIFGDPDEK